jgi:transposase-like protein
VRNKGHFPSDQAATKLIWLALRHITEGWKNPPISWHAAKAQLAIQLEERFVLSE